jgi:hypothetical protein
MNLLIALDEACNTLFGGDPHETMSSRLGKMAAGAYGRLPERLTAPIHDTVNWVAWTVFGQRHHCEASEQRAEGREDLLRHRGQALEEE